jgi:predicted DNA-binding ribbon-helix-helix protein
MNSRVKKRSIVIGSFKTSISLEDIFWTSLRQIARERATTVSEIVRMLDASRDGNLSSTVRVFILDHYRNNVVSTGLPSSAAQFGQLSGQNAESAPGRTAVPWKEKAGTIQ